MPVLGVSWNQRPAHRSNAGLILSVPGRSPGVLENKRIRPPFLADRRGRPVSWIDDRVIRQVEQLGEDAGHELLVTATEVGSTDRALKQDIAAEREGGSLGLAEEDHRARAMPRYLANLERETRQLERLSVINESVRGGARERNAERAAQVQVGIAERSGIIAADQSGARPDRPP